MLRKKHIARCKAHRLGFTSCVAAPNLMLGNEFKRVLSFEAKRLETKWNKHVKITGARTKFRGHVFEPKDRQAMG